MNQLKSICLEIGSTNEEGKAVLCGCPQFIIDSFMKINPVTLLEHGKFTGQLMAFVRIITSTPKLSDFIPCDEDGKPMEEPPFTIGKNGTKIYSVGSVIIDEWKAALSRVIWDGWELYVISGVDSKVAYRLKRVVRPAYELELLFFTDGNVRLWFGSTVINNPTYEDFTNNGVTLIFK